MSAPSSGWTVSCLPDERNPAAGTPADSLSSRLQAAEGEVAGRAGIWAGEELADPLGELRGIQDAVAVEVELREGLGGLPGAGSVRRGEPGVFRGVQYPVAVPVGYLDERVRRGGDGGVEAGPVPDGSAGGGGEFVRGDLPVAVGVHVCQQGAEQGALRGGNGLPGERVEGMAAAAA